MPTKDIGIVFNTAIYRNTSQIIKIFLANNGYLLGYARGIYKVKKLDFDGPFHPFFKYEIEFHGSAEHNDIALIISSKCLNNVRYNNTAKINFLRNIKAFIEDFFITGYKDKNIYTYIEKFIRFVDKTDNPKFIHYAYFIVNILKLMGLLNNSSLNKLKMSKRVQSFIQFLFTTNLMKEINTFVNNSLQREFLATIKNNFHHYYNTLVNEQKVKIAR